MKLNAKIHCGVKVMVELAIRTEGVMLKEVAEKHRLSVRFLDLIFANLKAAGLIRKLSGRKGYVLGHKPHCIPVYQVYRAFEPELELFRCVVCEPDCAQSSFCATNNLFRQLNHTMRQAMESVTIGMLMDQQKRLDSNQS